MHAGERVTIQGTVTTLPFWVVDSYLLGIRDDAGYGLAFQGQAADFEGIRAGDRIAATGIIAQRGGMAVLKDFRIEERGSGTPPGPLWVPLEKLEQIRHLGLAVTTEGAILETRQEEAGDSLVLGSVRAKVKFFVPKLRGDVITDAIAPFRVGDKVRVTGLLVQHCLLPPYDRSFQIVAYGATPAILVERQAGTATYLVSVAALLVGLIGLAWYLRNRWREKRRAAMKSLNALGEEILAAGSASEILDRLTDVIPKVWGATGVRLYEFHRKTRTLDRIGSPEDPDPFSINPDSPSGPLATGAALAFRSRAIVNVPDTRRSPLFKARGRPEIPRSVMFAPMFAQDEVTGVLEVDHAGGIRYFNHDEQAGVQHLANQVAASLRLLEQQAVREQLYRSEKLAATAQLVSGVAAELRSPLEDLLSASNRLLSQRVDGIAQRELQAIAAEAQRASEIVTRLVSFGRTENVVPRVVELNDLISRLTRFREREWKTHGIRVQEKLWSESLPVMAAQGQLEQVFLSILVYAEQSVLECSDKVITIGSVSIAKRSVVEVAFACPEGARDPFFPNPARNREDSGPRWFAAFCGATEAKRDSRELGGRAASKWTCPVRSRIQRRRVPARPAGSQAGRSRPWSWIPNRSGSGDW
jgi:GAF domain-containing protein